MIVISSVNLVFSIKNENILHPRWLQMYFNRTEFDRYARFNSWGSVREVFSFEDMCEVEIELPPLEIQQKFVDIYKALQANLNAFEKGSTDLKLLCDAYIENLRHQMPSQRIGQYLQETNLKNNNKYTAKFIKGISIKKEFIETKADTNDLSTTSYKIVKNGDFAFNPNTARMGDKFSIAYNNTDKDILVSSIYPVFKIKDEMELCSEYLMMFFVRSEFDRYVRFHSWGSAREMFNFEDICEVKIPIPNLEIQKAIVAIYEAYNKRKELCQSLKIQLKELCPVLIQGALKEAREKR